MLSSQKSILNYYQNSEKQYLTILYVMVRDEDEINVRKQLFELLHAVEKGQYLELTPNFFSRKLLKYLYDIGAFQATWWNDNTIKIISLCPICLISAPGQLDRIKR